MLLSPGPCRGSGFRVAKWTAWAGTESANLDKRAIVEKLLNCLPAVVCGQVFAVPGSGTGVAMA